MAILEPIWSLNGINLYNVNGNNNYNKALNSNLSFPKILWFITDQTNVKTSATKNNLQKAMTKDLDYPIELWFLGNENNLKIGKTKDTLQKAMTRFDLINNVITYPKVLWYLQNEDDRIYFNNGFHNIHPFKCMTNMDTYVKTYPKALWQAPNWKYYDYTLIHPICPDYELLGAFCHAKNINKLNIIGNISFGEFAARESGINTITVKPNASINYKDYSFKEGIDIIIEE